MHNAINISNIICIFRNTECIINHIVIYIKLNNKSLQSMVVHIYGKNKTLNLIIYCVWKNKLYFDTFNSVDMSNLVTHNNPLFLVIFFKLFYIYIHKPNKFDVWVMST